MMSDAAAAVSDPWAPWLAHPGPTASDWNSLAVSQHLLGETAELRDAPVPLAWVSLAATRLAAMRRDLHGAYVGLEEVTDWLLAGLVAREHVLLLGPPGVAKSELAVRTFQLLGLSQAASPLAAEGVAGHGPSLELLTDVSRAWEWWQRRKQAEQARQKYFHYLLTRFTQPEELFGPIEIALLRQGILARVNFGLLTGPGVRAAFLDEVFKAPSSILNTLLTLTQERQYFNWGGMVRSDLAIVLGASNELPGGFLTGGAGGDSGAEDFAALYPFLDRFPIRLLVPAASASSVGSATTSDLSIAASLAVERERSLFAQGQPFPRERDRMPGINDILLLGRACLEAEPGAPPAELRPPQPRTARLFDEKAHTAFWDTFMRIARALRADATNVADGRITWTISPRKLKSLYKLALAHALVVAAADAPAALGDSAVPLGPADLQVFGLIWDSFGARAALGLQLQAILGRPVSGARP